ncbi:MAG: outer membrane protein assembly factor [Ferruginibacter sp.]|nr:outer membrane protein assembly factor [Ferruginibacter sp.]
MRSILIRFFIIILLLSNKSPLFAQGNDTIPVSVNPALLDIMNSKYPKNFTISAINVTGSKAFDPNLIISISGLAVGDKIFLPGSDVFAKAIAKLWRQSLVSNVQIFITDLNDDAINIEIAIKERPRLIDFQFVGIKKSEREDLEPKVGLAKDRVLTENMKLSAAEVIRQFYYEKGYRNVSIETKEKIIEELSNGVALTFLIDKGKRVRINSINFSGNTEIEDAKLKKQMKGTKEMSRLTLTPDIPVSPYGDTTKGPGFKDYLKSFGFLSISRTLKILDPYFRLKIFSGSKFNDSKYAEDKESVLEYYNAQGLRDAAIVADTQMINRKGNLDIDIKVNEGRRYYFGNIIWRGNTKYSDSVLNLILGIKKGDVYNLETLNKRLGTQLSMEGGDIASLYQDDGYLFYRIDPIETAVYNDTIDFEIRMAEGPQASYGKISVSGNDKTKDYVILREMRTIPGNRYSRSDIIRTQRELSQLGFFNPEKISPNIVPNPDNGTVDINWQVEEKSSDQLELSAGFGGGIGLTGTLGVTFNNFSFKNITSKSSWDPLPSGDGQRLSLRAQSNGRAYRSYNFSFTEPWLGGKSRNSFSVNFYDTKFANTFSPFGGFCSACGDTSYLKTIGFGISLGKQLKWPDDFFNLIYSVNFQQYKLRNYRQIFSGLSNGTSTNISAKITLMRNSAGPNPIFPTSGSNFLFSGQFTLPYSLLGINKNAANQFVLPEFHKWRFNVDWYTPIGRARGAEKNQQFILRAAAKFGFIGRYNPNLEISPFERFQVGDAGLSNTQALLGYDIIAHRGYPIYGNSNPKINPEGITPSQYFTIFNKYTVELRYPFSTSAASTIYGLAFFEAANGWFSFRDYNPFKLRRSVGAGVRFFLPMFGLLGFDYGIGLDRYNQTSGIRGAAKFTFMLGQEPE